MTKSSNSGTNDANGINNGKKKKSLTNEELAEKKRKQEEFRKGNDALFAHRHVKSKQTKDKTMGDFVKQTILLEGSLSNMDRKLKPTDERFQKFIAMAEKEGAQLVLPTDDDMKLIDKLQSKSRTLKATMPRPLSFWTELAELKQCIDSVEPELKRTIKLIGNASSCYHVAHAMEELCVVNDDIINGTALCRRV